MFKSLSANDQTLRVAYLFQSESRTLVSLCALNQGQQLAVAVGFKQWPKLKSSDGLLIFPEFKNGKNQFS